MEVAYAVDEGRLGDDLSAEYSGGIKALSVDESDICQITLRLWGKRGALIKARA